jgi:hypothetical protein
MERIFFKYFSIKLFCGRTADVLSVLSEETCGINENWPRFNKH